MTNTTEIAPARWVTSARSAHSGYEVASGLIRRDANPDEVEDFFYSLTRMRGVHRVEIRESGWADAGSGWFSLLVYGTDRAVSLAAEAFAESGLREDDRNADHDHDVCIARAREMGVPASHAHTPETYLSS